MYFSAFGVSAIPNAREWRTVRRVRKPLAIVLWLPFLVMRYRMVLLSLARQSRLAINASESWPLMSLFARELRVIPPTVITTVSRACGNVPDKWYHDQMPDLHA